MKNKERLRTRIMKKLYGISVDYDEYKEKEVNRIGNNAFIWLWWYSLGSNFLAVIFGYKYPIETFWTYIIINIFVSVFVISIYLIIAIQKSKLTDNEIEENDLKTASKKCLRDGILSGIYFGFSMYLLKGLTDWTNENINIISYIQSPKNIVAAILEAILFGGFIYIIGKLRIKKQIK